MLRTLLAGATALGVLALPAVAAPACPLVVDARGDVGFDGTSEITRLALYDPSVDILSADFASDDRNFTVVVRVADLDGGRPLQERTYDLRFTTVPRVRIWATRTLGEPVARIVLVHSEELLETWLADAQVVFDDARNEVRMTAPIAPLRKYVRLGQGTQVRDLKSVAYVGLAPRGWYGDGYGYRADTALGTRSYRMGDPLCRP